MPQNNDTKWRVSQAEFAGYIRGKLESIHEDIQEIKSTNNKHSDKITELENQMGVQKIKNSLFGFFGGAAAIIVWIFFKK